MSEHDPIPNLTEDERECLLEYCGTKDRDGVGDHAVEVIDALRGMLSFTRMPENEQIQSMSAALERWTAENETLRQRVGRLEAEVAMLETALNIDESHEPSPVVSHACSQPGLSLQFDGSDWLQVDPEPYAGCRPYNRAADDAEKMGLNHAAEPAFRHIVEPQVHMRALSAEEIRQTWNLTLAIGFGPFVISDQRSSQESPTPAVQEMCCGGTCVRALCPYHGGNQ